MSMIPVRVGGLAIDERTKNPVVLLQEIEGNRVLPIWIGPMEASAIHSELMGKKYQRPLTHDLLVTIIDSLTTRLEYVDGSQSSSRKANFGTQENEGESLVLRWELIEPLKVNEGGIVRFKCRVR